MVDSTHESFIFEMTGSTEKIEAFINLMRPLGLADVARAGIAALSRGAAPLAGGLGWSPSEPALIIGGVEQTNSSAQASAVAGAQGLSNTTSLYLLLNVRHQGAIRLIKDEK